MSNVKRTLAPSKEFQDILKNIRKQDTKKPIMNDLPFCFIKPVNDNNKEVYFNFILNVQFCLDFLKSSERRNDLIFHLSNIIQFLLNKELYIFDDFKKHGPIMIQYIWEQSELVNNVLSKNSNFSFNKSVQINTKYNSLLEKNNIQEKQEIKLNNTEDLIQEIKKGKQNCSQKNQKLQNQKNINKKINGNKSKVKIEVLEERNEVINNVEEVEQEYFNK